MLKKIQIFILLIITLGTKNVSAQKDTLTLMTYNVLYYGSGCQGGNNEYHKYLETIVKYANPDILALVKSGAIKQTPDDKFGTAPFGFADSILENALNKAFPGRYDYCTFTNNAQTNNMCLLFYDKRKLSFQNIISSYINITDFNTYKLYYNDRFLSKTHDTTFLYITLNHDKSGDEYEEVRAKQIKGEMEGIKKHFKQLPNFINMGDFNVRSSMEPFYKMLTTDKDSLFQFFDPPFFPDKKLHYPADWDHNPAYSAYFTTSTRESATIPNSCGTGGGAKNWYDHIFLSSWIVNNKDYIRYIPNSYRTLGNDGKRFKISINNNTMKSNNAAPKEVIDALYKMSNKYPVLVDLEFTSNSSGNSLPNPEIPFSSIVVKEEVKVEYVESGELKFLFPDAFMGQEISLECIDTKNEVVLKKVFTIKNNEKTMKFKYPSGNYTIKMKGKHNLLLDTTISIK